MSTTSEKSERFWALKSTNLKQIKKEPQSQINNVRNRTRNGHSHVPKTTDIRKSSYPVLPDVSNFRNDSAQSFNSGNSLKLREFDSANTSDYGSDTPTRISPHYVPPSPPQIVDNKTYHGISHNKYQNFTFDTKNTRQSRNNAKSTQKFAVRTEKKKIHISRNGNGINLQMFHAIQSVCLEIVDETLEDDLVLDVMIDAFKEMQCEVEQFNVRIAPAVRLTAEQILSEAIDIIIHETALMALMKDSKSHLRAQMVSRWTLDDIVKSLLTELTHDAVHDLVNDRLISSRSNHVCGKLIDEFIAEEIHTSEKSLFTEALLELILEEHVVLPVIDNSLRHTVGDMLDYYHQKISRINLQQINHLATTEPLASLVLSHLVSVGARQKSVYGPSILAQYCFENFVLEHLLEKTGEVYDKLANTIECRSLCHFHQEVNKTIASDSLLAELIEFTDADLCDLDAEEVQETYIPRYLGDLENAIYNNKNTNNKSLN